MKKPKEQIQFERLSVWQSIFLQSRVNGAAYPADPPLRPIVWPNSTWFRTRLDKIRKGEPVSLQDRLKASLQIVRANRK